MGHGSFDLSHKTLSNNDEKKFRFFVSDYLKGLYHEWKFIVAINCSCRLFNHMRITVFVSWYNHRCNGMKSTLKLEGQNYLNTCTPHHTLSTFFSVLIFMQIGSFRLLLLRITSKGNRRIRIDFYPFLHFTRVNPLVWTGSKLFDVYLMWLNNVFCKGSWNW